MKNYEISAIPLAIRGKIMYNGGNLSERSPIMSDRMTRILIVDDDPDIRELLRLLLSREGYSPIEAADGREAVEAVRRDPTIALILLDVMMPRMDGFEAAPAIRALTDAPILFLTARSSDADRTAAYAGGGDDYIVKPFHATDLRLKLGAMLRRYDLYRTARTPDAIEEAPASAPAVSGGILLPGDITWDPAGCALYRGGERVVLTDREYALFARLAQSRGENVTPATLYEDVWGEPYLASSSNTVIVHIANLRRKLEADPSGPVLIRTVWGKGYRID